MIQYFLTRYHQAIYFQDMLLATASRWMAPPTTFVWHLNHCGVYMRITNKHIPQRSLGQSMNLMFSFQMEALLSLAAVYKTMMYLVRCVYHTVRQFLWCPAETNATQDGHWSIQDILCQVYRRTVIQSNLKSRWMILKCVRTSGK